MKRVRRLLGGIILAVAFAAGVVFAGWALVLELRLLYEIGGPLLAIVGFLVLPFTIPLGALLAGVVYGEWHALLLVSGAAVSAAVGALGVVLLGKRVVPLHPN